MRPTALLLLVLLATPAGAACPTNTTTASFLAPGPFGVGVRTLTLVDTSRTTPAHGSDPELPQRTLTTEVWYPTAPGGTEVRDAPLAEGGPFPLVVNSPGLLDLRLGEKYYALALASRGFVVASLDFPLTGLATQGTRDLSDVHNQPGDVSFVIDSLLTLSNTPDSWLAKGVNRRKIGATGLSLGGLTTLLVMYHPTLHDPRIRAALPIAPVACFLGEGFYVRPRRPLLVMQGDQDLLVPLATNGQLVYERSRSKRELVILVAGSHTAFSGFVTNPSSTSYDQIGCSAVNNGSVTGNIFEGLGGADAGIDPVACTALCADPLPANPPMQALRQHEITQAVVVAFFESTLKRSRAGRCFLRDQLAIENPDVHASATSGR
jgi:fermentation-respiration switch protein FrsA (DUF1100 family)